MTEGKKKNGENDERKLDPDVQKALEEARRADKRLEGKEQRIFPVLRAKTHPLENKAGEAVCF